MRLVLGIIFTVLIGLASIPVQARLDFRGDNVAQNLYIPLAKKSNECTPQFDFIPSDDESKEQAVFEAMNVERAAHGVPPLTLNADLTQASRLHSRDMADNDFRGHAGSNGSRGGDRIGLTCYKAQRWGENVGWNTSGNPVSMMTWWMQSPGHRAAILNPSFSNVGVGYAKRENSYWGHYWTVNFGAPQE